ncbi:unnamed protein product [Paramecium sonneborni]|uniref:Uncharacterized protein n=1 Tax=Paramecium sonneborni TaxID=65129 RepID=A0A8S1R807_9CILI|nr:unnamed protein product [Paramecium sonneborni]
MEHLVLYSAKEITYFFVFLSNNLNFTITFKIYQYIQRNKSAAQDKKIVGYSYFTSKTLFVIVRLSYCKKIIIFVRSYSIVEILMRKCLEYLKNKVIPNLKIILETMRRKEKIAKLFGRLSF